MVDTKQEVIQELKDILKDLGFQENKKILGYVKKTSSVLKLYIYFVNRESERIDINHIDILLDLVRIKSIYYSQNTHDIQCSKMFTIKEFNKLKVNKKEYIKTEINELIENVLERV